MFSVSQKDNSHHCYDCNLNFELSTMLLMHNLDQHRKTGVSRRKISSFLSNILENEILYSSDSECEYQISTTVRRIAKTKPELNEQNDSSDNTKTSNRMTRSGLMAVITRETFDIDRVDDGVQSEISCHMCGLIVETEEILKEHIRSKHEIAIKTENDIGLLSELSKEIGNNPTTENDFTVKSVESKKRVRTKKFSCDICSKLFKQKAALAKHIKQHSRIEDEDEDYGNNIVDDISDNYDTEDSEIINSKTKSSRGFSNRDSSHRHLRGTHQIENKDSDNKTNQCWTCEICGKLFYRPKCFATHLKKHDESVTEKRRTKSPKKKTHLCSFCGKAYPGSNHLKIHLRIHTGERPFKCQYCDKTFAIKKTWQDHTYSHTGEKPYFCPVENCGKRFTHSTGVRQHMQCCHSSEKQFQCPHCDKKCSKKTHLEDHIRSHTGERPYECKYCGIKFRLTSTLRIHHRTHTGERPFVCQVCNRGFIKSYGLKQHMKSKRNCLPTSTQPTLTSQIEQQQDIDNNTTEDVQFHQLLILPSDQVLS